MRLFINPYVSGSVSAEALSTALREAGVPNRRLKTTGSTYVYKPGDIIVNWGSSRAVKWAAEDGVLNSPSIVHTASNKRLAFNLLSEHGVKIPRYTDDYLQALEWLHNDGLVLAARTKLTGHSGQGIVLTNEATYLPKAHLFTEFNKSKGEYRFHVFNGKVIDHAKKRRKTGEPPIGIEKSIRSHANGWIFARKNADGSDIPIPNGFQAEAIRAVKALGLIFGAVDVINVDGSPVVLEVNTAPGLSGDTTVDAYVGAIKKYIEDVA